MAEQIISPGVFTKENDLSFLPAGVEAIGAAVVGPTVKGPAFHPTICRSFADYERKFGPLSSETFVPQTVREYIKSAGAVTVVRVLAGEGWTLAPAKASIAIGLTTGGTAAGTHVLSVGDGDATCSATTEKETVVIRDGFGVNKTYVVTHTAAGGVATGTVLTADSDTGSGTAGAALVGGIAVGINLSSSTQNALLVELRTAIMHANGHNGSITVSTSATDTNGDGVPDQADGTQSITLTFPKGIPSDPQDITKTIGDLDLGAITYASTSNTVLVGLVVPAMTAASSDPGLEDSTMTTSASLADTFPITFDGTNHSAQNLSASLNPSQTNYLFKQLGYKPTVSKDGAVSYGGGTLNKNAYSYLEFKNILTDAVGSDYTDVTPVGLSPTSSIVLGEVGTAIEFTGGGLYTEKYSYASTPTITSGFLDPGIYSQKQTQELFTFHTLDHGTSTNKLYKISISNQKTHSDIDGVEQYSTFNVEVRKYSDKDKTPFILETYNNCNLNPDDGNYIAKKIGDRYSHYNSTLDKLEVLGSYPNLSNYIRVEVNAAVEDGSVSPKLLPKGFKAPSDPIPVTSINAIGLFPSASYEGTQTIGGNYSSKGHLGWKFDDKRTDNGNWVGPVADGTSANVVGDFNIDNYTGHTDSGFAHGTGALSASIDVTGATGPTPNQLKFSVPFQGGDDGVAPWKPKFTGAESTLAAAYTSTSTGQNLYGFDLSSTSAAGYTGYKKALDILSNQDEYDINMLAMPGVIKQYHSSVTQAGIDMVENRGDAFYVMDLCGKNESVNTALNQVAGIDTNYAAVYYPWVKVNGARKPVFVPPSVVVPGAIAKSDQIGQGEWFAPAGLNRGLLGNVIEAKIRLNQSERDRLYDDKINPIASFPGVGSPVIWGQKTLQSRSTALDRINVRRLLIAVKKFIASSSKYLVFEANTTKTRARFLNIVNPYLEAIQQRQGLYAFRVQMDGGNNTPDVIDRNQLVGGIYLQPTKTAEFIVLDFNILPTGATFDA